MYQDGESSRKNRLGVRLLLVLLLVSVMSILTACMESEPTTLEFEEYKMHFLKVEKNSDSNVAYAYYESPEEQTYYKTELSSYQYNNWDTVGYPEIIEVIKNTYKYGSFGGDYYKAYILSSKDVEQNKTFKDVNPDELDFDMFTVELKVTEYWDDEVTATAPVKESEEVSNSKDSEDSEKSAE